MVFEDTNSSKSQSKRKVQRTRNNAANPFDRLGAFVVDVFIVLTPLISLVTAPLKKVMMASALFEHESSFNFIVALSFFMTFLIAVAYQYLCLVYLRGSIGKKVFRLRVEGLFEKQLTRSQSFARALAWPLAPITLGLSCLGVLSDSYRRAFHDRWADTKVISLVYETDTPSDYEVWLARGARIFLLAIFALTFFAGYTQFYYQLASGKHLQQIMESRGDLCREVSGFYEEFSERTREDVDRLNAAFTMYNLGDLDKSCLVEEVEFAFRYSEPTGLSYLIKSILVRDTNAKLSKVYRERLCKGSPESEECLIGDVFTLWEDKNWVQAEEKLSEILSVEAPSYLIPWAIELKLMLGKHDEMRDLLKSLPSTVSFRRYSAKMKAMAEAQTVFNQPEKQEFVQDSLQGLADVFNSFESFELASWMCYQSYQVSCDAEESSACRAMDDMVAVSPELLVDDYLGAIWVRKQSCNKRSKVSHKKYLQRSTQKLLEAIQELRRSPIQARNKLWGLATNSQNHSSVTSEAARYYIESARSKEELKRMVISWKLWEPTFEWQVTGQKLINKLYDYRDHRSVILVGELLNKKSELTKDIKQKLFVAYYRESEHSKAKQILGELKVIDRKVASSNEFQRLSKKLRKKGSKGAKIGGAQ